MSKVSAALQAMGVSAAAILAATLYIIPAEGEVTTVFTDSLARSKTPTVCYGTTHKEFVLGKTYTVDECIRMLADDLVVRDAALRRAIKVPVTDQQLAVYLDHAYQFGISAFTGSTMLKKLNAAHYAGACQEFTDAKNNKGEAHGWVYTNGKNCRIRTNKCYGMVVRAERNRAACLAAIPRIIIHKPKETP